ncbi:hypothetical protein C0966_16720 [Bacillus methanolicus]|nr:hypothetical protein [Bacillus methanolicus]
MLSLEESLYVTCVIPGEKPPEMEQWKKEIDRDQSKTTNKSNFLQVPTLNLLDDSMIKTQPYVREIKVGRNAPCPCGSGKK